MASQFKVYVTALTIEIPIVAAIWFLLVRGYDPIPLWRATWTLGLCAVVCVVVSFVVALRAKNVSL